MPKSKSLVLFLAVASLAACAGGLRAPGGTPGAPAAPAAVERFLQLARERDYNGMGWVFGTSEGALIQRDDPAVVEQRMYALASLLEHDSFVVGSGSPVPGRGADALRFEVTIRRGAQARQVPFTAVRGPGGRWYVEQLAVEAITGG